MGYTPYLFNNLIPFVGIFAVLVFIWIFALIIQAFFRKSLGITKVSLMVYTSLNILTRFWYEAFLEIAVCCLLSTSIAISVSDFSIAILLLCLLAVSLCFFTVLFFKGGPYLDQPSYERRTFLNFLFCWEVRRVNANVEAIA